MLPKSTRWSLGWKEPAKLLADSRHTEQITTVVEQLVADELDQSETAVKSWIYRIALLIAPPAGREN
jgi:hypothetical protein